MFGAQLLTLPQIFENRFFTIPDYQRGYSWDERQVGELLQDLDHLLDDQAAHCHYTGTLVLSRAVPGEDAEYHVVDGQQRLTTFVTVMRSMADRLPADHRRAEFNALYLRRGAVGSDRAVLRLNSDTRHFFEHVVLGSGDTNNEPMTLEAHGRLYKTRKLVQAWVQDRLSSGISVENLLATIEHKVGFLVYAPIEDAETGIMFEVINNRGKPLSELEKVKNYLIYCCVKLKAPTLRADIDIDWSAILGYLNVARKTSPSEEGAFLRYCMVVYFKLNKTDSQYGYDELKKRLALDASMKDPELKQSIILEITKFVHFMKLAALWYARLYGQWHKNVEANLVSVLEQIRGQDRHASIMPIFLALVIRNDGRGAVLRKLLQLLERVNFRVYLARNITLRNDTGQGDLYAYAASYFYNSLVFGVPEEDRKLPHGEILNDHDALEYRLVEFALLYSPDSLLEASFKLDEGSSDDFYKWGGLRYFLMNYEQHLQPHKTIQIDKITLARSEGKSADYLSVEHRWAVENRNVEGENNRAVDTFEKRRLGNFVLLELRLNIQAGNASLEEKLANYLGGDGDEPPTDLEQVRKMAKDAKRVLAEMAHWTRSKNYYLELHREINTRVEERSKKFALNRWSLKEYVGFKELKSRAESGWNDGDE